MMRATIVPTAICVGALQLAAAGCGEDRGSVEVTLSFPSSASEVNTETVHVYVLEPDDDEEVGCAELVGDVLDPLSSKFGIRGDVVIRYQGGEGTTNAVVADLDRGDAVVYAEAANAVGVTLLAGCSEMPVASGTQLDLTLVPPGTFDCSDPDTQDGAPCDDGTFCTTGQTCQSGQCSGGGPRDCSFVEDECNGSECSEELGCQPVAVPDGRSCDDGLYCTEGDQCIMGECTSGGPRDCTSFDGSECGLGECNEVLGSCELVEDDADCADACFQSNTCNLSGLCEGTDPTCTDPGHECYTVECTDNAGTAECSYVPVGGTPACSDQCQTGGTCDGVSCTGGTPTGTNPASEVGLCNNGLDDDCDSLIDADDTDDCP